MGGGPADGPTPLVGNFKHDVASQGGGAAACCFVPQLYGPAALAAALSCSLLLPFPAVSFSTNLPCSLLLLISASRFSLCRLPVYNVLKPLAMFAVLLSLL